MSCLRTPDKDTGREITFRPRVSARKFYLRAKVALDDFFGGHFFRNGANRWGRCERINTAKQKDGLTSCLILSVLEAKIFQYGFVEEHNVCVNNHFRSST